MDELTVGLGPPLAMGARETGETFSRFEIFCVHKIQISYLSHFGETSPSVGLLSHVFELANVALSRKINP